MYSDKASFGFYQEFCILLRDFFKKKCYPLRPDFEVSVDEDNTFFTVECDYFLDDEVWDALEEKFKEELKSFRKKDGSCVVLEFENITGRSVPSTIRAGVKFAHTHKMPSRKHFWIITDDCVDAISLSIGKIKPKAISPSFSYSMREILEKASKGKFYPNRILRPPRKSKSSFVPTMILHKKLFKKEKEEDYEL